MPFTANGTLTFTPIWFMEICGKTIPFKIKFSAGTNIQYKFSKTFALNSGVDYFNLSYQYNLTQNQFYDQLTYLSFPLTLRVFPSKNSTLRQAYFTTDCSAHKIQRSSTKKIKVMNILRGSSKMLLVGFLQPNTMFGKDLMSPLNTVF